MTSFLTEAGVQTLMPSAYLEAMVETSMRLLSIEEGRDVSLIMGYPVHLTNSQAIACWINHYLSEHPENTNFKQSVFPALLSYLRHCEEELLAWC